MSYTNMAEVLPEGKIGEAEVRHLKIGPKEAAFSQLRCMVTRGREQPIAEGLYAQLYVKSAMMMSDTQMERDTNRELLRKAQGKVLIAGLGLGMVVLPLINKPDVKEVTVVEKSSDVIQLVDPSLRGFLGPSEYKLRVLHGDILQWDPPKESKWDTIYFDIWPVLNQDLLPEMRALHKRFRKHLASGGWMDSWRKHDLETRRR